MLLSREGLGKKFKCQNPNVKSMTNDKAQMAGTLSFDI
jgi:hypothetical protein